MPCGRSQSAKIRSKNPRFLHPLVLFFAFVLVLPLSLLLHKGAFSRFRGPPKTTIPSSEILSVVLVGFRAMQRPLSRVYVVVLLLFRSFVVSAKLFDKFNLRRRPDAREDGHARQRNDEEQREAHPSLFSRLVASRDDQTTTTKKTTSSKSSSKVSPFFVSCPKCKKSSKTPQKKIFVGVFLKVVVLTLDDR